MTGKPEVMPRVGRLLPTNALIGMHGPAKLRGLLDWGHRKSRPWNDCRLGRPKLFHGDRLREVAWLVYVAATADGDMIGEQLQGYDLEQRREHFDRVGHDDHVIGSFARQLIVSGDNGNYDPVARFYLFDVGHTLLIPRHGFRIVFIPRRQHDDRKILVDQSI